MYIRQILLSVTLLLTPLASVGIPSDLADMCHTIMNEMMPSREFIGQDEIVIYKNGAKCTQSWPDNKPIRTHQQYDREVNKGVLACSQGVAEEIAARGEDAIRADLIETLETVRAISSFFSCEQNPLEALGGAMDQPEPYPSYDAPSSSNPSPGNDEPASTFEMF